MEVPRHRPGLCLRLGRHRQGLRRQYLTGTLRPGPPHLGGPGLCCGEGRILEEGSVFAGYTILRELGRGGMGTVYLARHPRLPRTVALKLLARDLVADSESLRRFEREAELIAALDHPGIVTVFDRGSVDGQPWISMRYVEGTDASKLRAPDLPLHRAARIISDIADALDYAHGMGVLHRDIKPANILLTTLDGVVERALLSDFGIARAGSDASQLTVTGTINATLAYASPEQLVGSPLDGRADQYSLACTLFRILTGRTPFESGDPVATITGHLHLAPPTPSTCRPDLPQGLDAVLSRALAKRPEERFPSCRDFAAAVAATVDVPRSAVRATIEGLPRAAAPTDPVVRPRTPRSTAREPKRVVRIRRWQVALAVAGVVVLGVGSGLAVVGLLETDSRADAASPTTTTKPATTAKPVTPADTAEAQQAVELLRNTFPRMIPADANSKAGYLGTSCEPRSKVIVPKAMSGHGIDFGDWVSVWRCLGGTGKCCAYFLLSYRTPADVQGVIDKLPANTKFADSVEGLSVTNYQFFRPEITRDAETGNLITTFPGDPVRGAVLMYAVPGFQNSLANRNERAETMASWLRGTPLT
ncbi:MULTISPECIES: serine/threonine-protein kinase [unclassified Nocardia]|uniref:serine/threonine-protein kinase n=1 Tax=Nocardia sp. NPDC004970 TaxID=3364305 RepID=UPI0036B0D8C2